MPTSSDISVILLDWIFFCIGGHMSHIHIDVDDAEIDKNVLTDHHIIGSARRVLELMLKLD